MSQFYRWLLGDTEEFPFEQRMFHVTLLLGFITTLFGVVVDFRWALDVYALLGFAILWLFLYHLSRFGGYFKRVSRVAFSLLVFVFMPYGWFSTNGSYGVFPYYSIIILAVMCIILSGRTRIILIGALIVIQWLMLLIDKVYYLEIPFYHFQEGPDFFIDHYLMVLLVMTALLLVYSTTYMAEKEQREAHAKTIEETSRQQLYYMQNLESLIDKLKSERHDFNHHLGVVYGLLEGQDDLKARAYLKKQVVIAEEYHNIVSMPYSLIRAILNYKLSCARDAGIELKVNINVPENLDLNEYDMTLLLGNLLDNAIEASKSIKDQPRSITLNLEYKPDYLVIQVENTINDNVAYTHRKGYTSKADRDNHGFGLKNIEFLVNKHNGLMKIEPVKGIFKVNIALLIGPGALNRVQL